MDKADGEGQAAEPAPASISVRGINTLLPSSLSILRFVEKIQKHLLHRRNGGHAMNKVYYSEEAAGEASTSAESLGEQRANCPIFSNGAFSDRQIGRWPGLFSNWPKPSSCVACESWV